MATQSINLGTTTAATFNGTTVNKINLNGSQIWAAPSSCENISSASPRTYEISYPFTNPGVAAADVYAGNKYIFTYKTAFPTTIVTCGTTNFTFDVEVYTNTQAYSTTVKMFDGNTELWSSGPHTRPYTWGVTRATFTGTLPANTAITHWQVYIDTQHNTYYTCLNANTHRISIHG
jgi:hypothetical protein